MLVVARFIGFLLRNRMIAVTSAPAMAFDLECASHSLGCLNPVTDSNCVVFRRGGQQLEVKDQSVG